MYSIITHNKASHWFRNEVTENWRDALHIEDSYTSCVFDALSFLSNQTMTRVLEGSIEDIDLSWIKTASVHQAWPSLRMGNLDSSRIEPDWLILDNANNPNYILAFEAKHPYAEQKKGQIENELSAIINTYPGAEINLVAVGGSNLHVMRTVSRVYTTSWLSILETCEAEVANLGSMQQDYRVLTKLIELLYWFGWRTFGGFGFNEPGLDPSMGPALCSWRIE